MNKASYLKRFSLLIVVAFVASTSAFSQEVNNQTAAANGISASQTQQFSESELNTAKNYASRGIAYYTGRGGVSRDYQKAYECLIEAAKYNNADALSVLGHMFENGNGVEKDYGKALEWYKKAADQNVAVAQNNVGFFYDEGLGVEKDMAEAARWYRKAADNNYPSAQYNLAQMYAGGIGVERDIDEALALYRKAYSNGIKEAQAEITKLEREKKAMDADLANLLAHDKNSKAEIITIVEDAGDVVGDFYNWVTLDSTSYVVVEPDDEPDENDALMVAEEMPEFPGGTQALLEFLRLHIKYPTICRENGIQGRVLVTFVVDKNGTIVSPEIVKSVNPYLDKEALRVISIMPQWKPGIQKGKPVRVKYTVPVNFRLND